MIGWHHRLDGCEFEQALEADEGQGSLACCSPWGRKESDTTERLNNNNGMQRLLSVSLMVTIMHKAIIDTQKIMRKESKCNTTESHQTMREESKKPEKQNKTKQMNYKTEKKIYLFMFVSGLGFPVITYGCERWTIKKAECLRIDVFELWC